MALADWRLSRKRGRFSVIDEGSDGAPWSVVDWVAGAQPDPEIILDADGAYSYEPIGNVVNFSTKAEALDYATHLRQLVRSGYPVDLTQAP